MITLVRPATSTAVEATRAASHAFAEMAPMLAVSSSAADAADCTLWLTESDSLATTSAWAVVWPAASDMRLLVAVSSSAAAASICALSPIAATLLCCAAAAAFRLAATRPSSSCRRVRAP